MTTSIFIPRINPDVTEDNVRAEFARQFIGNVTSVDFIPKQKMNPDDTVEEYFMAFVHLNWYGNQAALNIKAKLDNGEQSRIVYDDPRFWVLMKNKNPKQAINPMDSSNDLEEKLHCAFDMIMDLQARIHVLESAGAVPPTQAAPQPAPLPPPPLPPPPLSAHPGAFFTPSVIYPGGAPQTPPPPPPLNAPPPLRRGRAAEIPYYNYELSSSQHADMWNH